MHANSIVKEGKEKKHTGREPFVESSPVILAYKEHTHTCTHTHTLTHTQTNTHTHTHSHTNSH